MRLLPIALSIVIAAPSVARADAFSSTPPVSGASTFTATGGTTARGLSDRFAEVVNVKDFGAKGDGVTDDTAKIQLAAAAVPSTGAQLFFPTGNYLVSGPTVLKSNTFVSGRGAKITGAPAASWSGGAITSAFTSTATNVQVAGLTFAFPIGSANYGGGGYAHILEFDAGATRIVVRDNTSDGGGDFVSMVGAVDTLIEGNRATNVSNACYDHWGGAADARVIGNYCATYSGAGAGLGAIQFTGINTDQSAATTLGFQCIGNTIYINNGNSPQGIIINGHATGGQVGQVLIASNKIFVNNQSAWGILVNGRANNGVITGNYFEGGVATSGSYGAVSIVNTGSHWTVTDNVANNWHASTQGVFNNNGAGGILARNTAYSSSQLLGTNSSTVEVYGNDTGTGAINLSNVNISSGSAVFNSGFSSITSGSFGWNGAGGVDLTLNGAAGNSKTLTGKTAGVGRWALIPGDNVAESGGNTGSNFGIYPLTDAGAYSLPASIYINRSTGNVTFGAGAILAQTTVAGLPTCNAGLKGALYGVTDALAPTYNGALTGGGTTAIPVYCNGTTWTAH